MSYGITKNCINPDSYGVICVHCNACGRIDKTTMWQSRYDFYYSRLKELLDKYDDDFYKSNLQQTNIALDVIHFGKKIKECVAHIDFGGMDAFEIDKDGGLDV